jgi:ferredoxin-NADP reductase
MLIYGMKLQFKTKYTETPGVHTFVFEPQSLVSWIAGQSIRLELPAGWGSEERRFTISSAPFEKTIAITTRLSGSEFKQALANLNPGDQIDAYAIEGDFTWPQTTRKKLFIAAGIGVTPFYAMLKQRRHDGRLLDAQLLIGSSRDTPFKTQFQQWQTSSPELSVRFYNFRITGELVARVVPDFASHTIYIAGPNAMVDELGEALVNAGLPARQLRRDWFTGNLAN